MTRQKLSSTQVFLLKDLLSKDNTALKELLDRLADRSYTSLESFIYFERLRLLVDECSQLVLEMDTGRGLSVIEIIRFFSNDTPEMVKKSLQMAVTSRKIRKEPSNHIARFYKPAPGVTNIKRTGK